MSTLADEIKTMLWSGNPPARIVEMLKKRNVDKPVIAKAMLEAKIDVGEIAKLTGYNRVWLEAQSKKIENGW